MGGFLVLVSDEDVLVVILRLTNFETKSQNQSILVGDEDELYMLF